MSWNAQNAIQKLDGFQLSLRDESDRWSPRRPTREAQNQAKMLVRQLAGEPLPEARIEATIDGGIEFEWAVGERELSIGISDSGEISYLKALSKTPIDEGPVELAKLDDLTNWLLYGG